MAAFAALLAMVQPTLGATYLCVEDAATGFDWENGRWVQSNFFTSTHIVRQISDGEEIGAFCRQIISEMAPSTPGSSPPRFGCYGIHDVGETLTSGSVSRCREFRAGGVEVTLVRCEFERFAPYEFEPSGEFIMTRTFGVGGPNAEGKRDSLAISVGKCSVIAP